MANGKQIKVNRASWMGDRSAMIVLAFSMAMDEPPVAEISRAHQEPTCAGREAKLIELARNNGFELVFAGGYVDVAPGRRRG